MKLTHRSTMLACYNGYITQAICINLAPLLYLTFQRSYGLTVGQISALIAVNFLVQLSVDLVASLFSKSLNLRVSLVFAHLATVVGLIGLAVFPACLPPFFGLLLAEGLLGIGGGFTEVVISPLMEACPTEGKSGNMSLLHSFYCWGQAGVVLFSGIYFSFFPIEEYWQFLPLFWAIIPLLGAIAFCVVPIYRLPSDKEKGKGSGALDLFKTPVFWSFLLMMLCAGASELIMSQWASSFVEATLGVEKSLGDLLGPCMFALMMGLCRALYGKYNQRLRLEKAMLASCTVCIVAYLLAAFAPIPAVALAGCALCGIGVGIFWPGTLSYAAERMPRGGLAMFALLAVAGDAGCLVGPSVAGTVAGWFSGDLRYAFCVALIFPILNIVVIVTAKKDLLKRSSQS
ncbi:MAG: MFS transporter [Clostridia bacterium]|nr:MFS transporter [Clostridia bacterium]